MPGAGDPAVNYSTRVFRECESRTSASGHTHRDAVHAGTSDKGAIESDLHGVDLSGALEMTALLVVAQVHAQ